MHVWYCMLVIDTPLLHVRHNNTYVKKKTKNVAVATERRVLEKRFHTREEMVALKKKDAQLETSSDARLVLSVVDEIRQVKMLDILIHKCR